MQFDQRNNWGRDTYQVRYVHAAYSVLDLLLAAQPKEFLSHTDSETIEAANGVLECAQLKACVEHVKL